MLLGEPGAELLREGDAVGGRCAADRDERDDVDGPEPRVGPLVLRQVDVDEGLGDHRLHRPDEGRTVPEEGQDGAVVVGVGGPVEKEDSGARRDRGVADGRNHFRAAPFADVRDAFDQCRHLNLSRIGTGDLTAGAHGACRRKDCLLR